jgi:GT2 family glycosyltransferase
VTTKLIRKALPRSPMLVAAIGFFPQDPMGDLGLAAPSDIVDLDALDPGVPLQDPESGVLAIIARTSTDLRRAASLAAVFPKATHIVVAVAQSPPHRPTGFPAVSPEWRALRTYRVERGAAGDWTVEARFSRAMPVGEFVASLTRGFDQHRLPAALGPRIALAGASAPHWRPGDPGAIPTTETGPLGDPDQHLPADLVLRSTGPESPAWGDPRVPVVDRPRPDRLTWSRFGATGGTGDVIAMMPSLYDVDAVPPVDERSVNPAGFIASPALGCGSLTQTGDCWSIQVDPDNAVRFHPSGAVTDADVARLRQLRAVGIEWGRHSGPLAAVRVIAGLAAAGVPLYAAHVPSWARALGADLIDVLQGVDETGLADDLHREEHSVRLRRAALRTHSTQARWHNLARTAGLVPPAPPRVSVVLCTRRPDYLSFALNQIGRQRNVDLEVILALHGIPADAPEVKTAAAGFDRPLTVVEVPADVCFGEALNRGVSRASGRYIAKWDDDDWYGPEFLADLILASSYTGAELLGCFAQLVYLEQINLTIYRPAGESERITRQVAGATFLIERSAFDSVGGFPLVPRGVDAAMLDALRAAGGRIYRTHGLGFLVNRRATGHTWNPAVSYFLRSATRQWRGLRLGAFIESDDAESIEPLSQSERRK